MTRRYGLNSSGTFYETPGGGYFTYRYSGMWTLYACERDEQGRPVMGGNDEYLGAWPTLVQAAADLQATVLQDLVDAMQVLATAETAEDRRAAYEVYDNVKKDVMLYQHTQKTLTSIGACALDSQAGV